MPEAPALSGRMQPFVFGLRPRVMGVVLFLELLMLQLVLGVELLVISRMVVVFVRERRGSQAERDERGRLGH